MGITTSIKKHTQLERKYVSTIWPEESEKPSMPSADILVLHEAPDLPWQPEQAIALLKQLIESHRDETVLLIGSSLGGYYAQYLGCRFLLPVVLINPALKPVPLLLGSVGEQRNYYTQEVYHLSEEAVHSLQAYAVDAAGMKKPVLVLLDKGDELVDYRVALNAYQGIGMVKCFDGGSHRFDHLDAARDLLKETHSAS